MVLLFLYIIVLIGIGAFYNPHIVRAAFIRTHITQSSVLFHKGTNYHIYEDTSVLSNVNISVPQLKGSSLKIIRASLTFLDTFYLSKCKNFSIYVPARPTSIAQFCTEKGIRGSCYNDAILPNFILQKMGFRSRNVVLDFTDGYGGSGHTVVEVWMPDMKKWILVDAQNLAIFKDSTTGELLSAFEVRKKLLKGDSASLVILQYGKNYLIPANKLKRYYIKEMPLLVLIRNSNFESVYARNPLMSILEHLETSCGKPCFLMARFIRIVITREERVVYVDESSPRVNFLIWRNILLFLLTGFIASLLVHLFLKSINTYVLLQKRENKRGKARKE